MDHGSCRRWESGGHAITQLVELELPVSQRFLLSGADSQTIAGIDWLAPHYTTADGKLLSAIQAFVIDDGTNRIVVDTCIGKDKRRAMAVWSELDGPFLANLEAAGYPAETITHVVCTHLHLDHVGWNTRQENGRWVPTFPNARYVIARQEWDTWKDLSDGEQGDVMADSVTPLFEAGRVDLLDWNAPVTPRMRLVATPGHTPGHCSVLLKDGSRQTLISGDTMHHPVQVAHPEWGSPADADPEQAKATRRRLVDDAEDGNWLLFGTHFPRRPCGCVVQRNGQRQFLAVEPDAELALDRRHPKPEA